MTKNTASQKIGAQMVAAADGSAFTGSVTVSVTVDAGTQATGSVGSGACAHEGNGYHTYAPAQAETNGALLAFTFTGTGAVPATVQVFTTGFDKTAAQVAANTTHFGGSAGTFASGVPEVKTASLGTTAKSDVNAEVVDCLNVDTYAEPGQEAPPATTTLVKKIGYVYKLQRNRKTETATQFNLFADNATTVDQKATISDDTTTTDFGELGTGP